MASKRNKKYTMRVISQTTQAADNKGEDTNAPVQVNPVTTKP